MWVIDRLKNNKTNMSGLDFLTSYALLATQKSEVAKKLQDTEAEMQHYENG